MAVMNVITKKMPTGFPGQVARQSFNIIETHFIDPTDPVTRYGAPVVMTDDGKVRVIKAADTANKIYGFTVRPDAVQLGGDNPSFGDSGIPDITQPVDIMIKGYMNVKTYGDMSTVAVTGQPVSVTKSDVTVSQEVVPAGTVSDPNIFSDNAVQVPGASFMGPVDEFGICQIRIL